MERSNQTGGLNHSNCVTLRIADPHYYAILTADELLSALQALDVVLGIEWDSEDIPSLTCFESVRDKLWQAFNRADLRQARPAAPLPKLQGR